jgi:hypothetical protein
VWELASLANLWFLFPYFIGVLLFSVVHISWLLLGSTSLSSSAQELLLENNMRTALTITQCDTRTKRRQCRPDCDEGSAHRSRTKHRSARALCVSWRVYIPVHVCICWSRVLQQCVTIRTRRKPNSWSLFVVLIIQLYMGRWARNAREKGNKI